jgi:hypothetical protein
VLDFEDHGAITLDVTDSCPQVGNFTDKAPASLLSPTVLTAVLPTRFWQRPVIQFRPRTAIQKFKRRFKSMAVAITSRLGAARAGVGAFVSFGALLGLMLFGPIIGQLIAHVGLPYDVAFAIVTFVGWGVYLISIFYPWALPLVGTVRLLIFFLGFGGAVGW